MNSSGSLRRIVFLIASGISVPYFAFTQIDTGSIIGTVQDPSGSSVISAIITATNQETGVVANEAGQYD